MRPILIAAALVLFTPAAFAQSSRDACDMADKGQLEALLGPAPDIVEQHGEGTGVSFCHWRGAEGVGVRLHSITAASQNIAGGTALDYFMQNQSYQLESLTPANAHERAGPWQAGYIVDVTSEPNPDRVYSITFINKDDTVTLETYGLPMEETVRLAEAVAEAM